MQQSKQSKKSRLLLWPALAAAVAIGGVTSQVMAEGSSSSAEVQRGVPGIDVDMNANRSQGLDMDMQAGNRNDSDTGLGADPDTRTLGAGPDTGSTTMDTETEELEARGMRAPIQDRN